MKHFKFTSKSRIKFGRKLYQIEATISFGGVEKGQLGGWIEKGATIDEECWVYEDAEVFKEGEIRGGEIRGGVIRGGEIRGGVIWGGVIWGGEIRGGVIWGGVIRGGEIRGGVIRGGEIRGGEIRGGEIRGGEIRGGEIRGGVDLISFSSVGSENGVLTAYMVDNKIEVVRGCFRGGIDEFKKAVKRKHKGTDVGKEYLLMIDIIKLRFKDK